MHADDRRAACASPGVSAEIFVSPVKGPEDTSSTLYRERNRRETAARKICRNCPIRYDCLADALDEDKQAGFRGGYSAAERRQYLAEIKEENKT